MGSAGQAQGELTVPCIFQAGAPREPGAKAASGSGLGSTPTGTKAGNHQEPPRWAAVTCGFRGLGPSCPRQKGGAEVGWWGDPSKLQHSREHIQPGLRDEGHDGPALCHAAQVLYPAPRGFKGT